MSRRARAPPRSSRPRWARPGRGPYRRPNRRSSSSRGSCTIVERPCTSCGGSSVAKSRSSSSRISRSLEPSARLDRRAAGVGRGEPLQPVGPAAEPAPGQVGHHLAEARAGIEPRDAERARRGARPCARRTARPRSPTRRAPRAWRFDRIQLLVGQLQRERQQQPLRGRVGARELRHHRLVQHPLVRRVLVHDDDALGRLVHDVGVEHLEQRRVEAGDRRRSAGAGVVGRAVGAKSSSGRAPPELGARRAAALTPGIGRQSPTGAAATSAPSACAHRLLDHPLDPDAVAEAHLELGRMDVHVHVLGRDLDARDTATAGRPDGWRSDSPPRPRGPGRDP